MLNKKIKDLDPELFAAIEKEKERQELEIELIASENYASKAVMEAQGSCLTNKYAEGYAGKRYYGGCDNVDVAEDLATSRLKELFDVNFVNVQPHSGSQANAAVFQALLSPNDKVLGMKLDHGGHLTHGSKVNFSGKNYESFGYGITEEGFIDYEEVRQLAREHKPKMIIAGFSAYSGIVDWACFREIADEVGAYLMADIAHVAGLVATGLYPSPANYAHVFTSTTHKTLGGPRGGIIMTNDEEIAKKINSAIFPGIQGGPLMHIIAAKAVAFKEALSPEFKDYQQKVLDNANAMCERLKSNGLNIVSNGTKNHLFLVDLRSKGITGKEAEALLGSVNITVNKNSIPNDPASPFVTSGLRIGVPAVTRRGFGIQEVELVADLISETIENKDDEIKLKEIKSKVIDLCKQFKIYE
jgi:glycine hydroxymethyltransferase